MQGRALADLAGMVEKQLQDSALTYGTTKTFVTPRRLVLVIGEVAEQQADREVERRGPRVEAPEKAREGFLRSLGGADYRLDEQEDKKGRFIVARYTEEGRPTRALLAEALPEIFGRFPWPKSMRWGEGEARWVRPLHGIVCLFDGEVVPFTFAGIESGRTTRGHRFMAPEPIEVRGFEDYGRKLGEAKVWLDPAGRRARIEEEARRLAEDAGCRLRRDPRLLDELAGLVEWPVPLLGHIDKDFMSLPPEVLVTTMRENQKYLALEDGAGALAPHFVVVANIAAPDGGRAIVAGNERVLRARLWDARFFWDQDRKQPLESRLPDLEPMVFHAELGTMAEKVERMIALAGRLVDHVPGAERAPAERAAMLAKADLVTGMVGEFPELQGRMGRYYALEQGEESAVAEAIAEHYAPLGPDDACPTAPSSVVVALADKIDTLTGFFGIGVKPTGSGDPFALRRAALGVIRLVLENGLRLPLRAAFAAAHHAYGTRMTRPSADEVAGDLLGFFAERLKVHLRGEGVRHDLITAVFGAHADDDLVRLLARVRALEAFLETDDGRNLQAAFRRGTNIVRIEEKKDGTVYAGEVAADALSDPGEKALFEELERLVPVIEAAVAEERFADAMAALARLRPSVDRFFDEVLVNAKDQVLRRNRLNLLAKMRQAFVLIADFSVIEE